MFIDPSTVHPYHFGLVACALLALAVVLLLIPRGRRRIFLEKIAWGLVSGLGAGAILVALLYMPVVGSVLMGALGRLLPYAAKIGIHQPPLGTVLVVFSVLGFLIGLSAGTRAVLQSEQSKEHPAPRALVTEQPRHGEKADRDGEDGDQQA